MTIKILFFFTIIMYCTAANNNTPSISGEFVAMWEFSDPADSNGTSQEFIAWSPQTNRYKYQYQLADPEDNGIHNIIYSIVGDFNLVINYNLEALVKLILELYNCI